MKKFSIILILLFICTCNISAKEQFIYRKISHNEGLSSSVSSIYKEKDGDVWLGSISGLYRFNGHDIIHLTDPLFAGKVIHGIEEDSHGGLWVLSSDWIMYRRKGEEGFRLMRDDSGYDTLPFFSMCEDKDGLWFGSQGCIYRYTFEDEQFGMFRNFEGRETFFCSHVNILDESTVICSSSNGNIIVDTGTGELKEAPEWPFSEVSGIMTDSHGRLWLAFYNNGIHVYEKDGTYIRSYTTENSGLSNDLVTCFTEKDSKIWAGTDGGGINIIDPADGSIKVLSHIAGDSSSFPAHSIKCIHTDHYGNIWAGSTRDGLIIISQSGMKTHKDSHIGNPSGMSNRTVLCLFQEEDDDIIWIGTDGGGLNRYDPSNNRFTHYESTLNTKIITISAYSETELLLSVYADRLWLFNKQTGKMRPLDINDDGIRYFMKYTGRSLITANGKDDSIYLLSNSIEKFDKSTGMCHEIQTQEGVSTFGNIFSIGKSDKGLYVHDMFSIYRIDEEGDVLMKVGTPDRHVIKSGSLGSGGDIWLATDKGLCRFNEISGEFTHIPTNLFTDVETVVWDGRSRVWIGTDRNLFAYLTDEDSFAMFGESDGASSNEYMSKPRLLSHNGDVYIGGVQGLLRIDSEYTIDASETPVVNLYDISADRKRIYADKKGTYEIPRNSKLLSISVSTQETDIFRQKIYRFSVPDSGKEYEMAYPTLEVQDMPDPGKHDIFVSCTKRNGEWTEPTLVATIRVPYPWYLSAWFIAGILVFITLVAGSISIGLMSRKTNRLKLALKEQEQRVYEEKVNMLINISHELRTPLTLIMAPLKRLLNKTSPENEDSATLHRIYRQSRRMKSLLDMVLDLRKLEVGKNSIRLERTAFNEWISYTVEDIISEEDAEGIHIMLQLDPEVDLVDFDKVKCETVLMNMLMNAIKHSSKGDRITITTSAADDGFVRISVSDEGPGLGDIDRSRMFTRFYQSNNEHYGSGIGLSYSKILVELHGGRIGADNNPDKGATFWWEIPSESEMHTEAPEKAYLNELIGDNTADDMTGSETDYFRTDRLRLMLVDDSQDLLEFLCEAMAGEFAEIMTATSGNAAMKLISSGMLPDIIVSDVNMSDGDGYRLCKNIKGNDKYNHIPVILLTARGEEQSQGESYRLGADGFMAKPFEVETLMELIRSLLRRKEEIRKRYLDTEGESRTEYGSNEESFILQLNRIIAENISNPDLDQQLLCREMGVSRASLYNKMRTITGAGAKEYITRIRLEKAKSLIETTDLSIVDISEKTGFTSQSYFSTAFKAYTGMTPSQYKKQGR